MIATRKLFNGDWRRRDVIDHWERGCCANIQATYDAICREIVDCEIAPAVWNLRGWLGAEASLDFHGRWMDCYGLFEAAYELTFFAKDQSSVESLDQLDFTTDPQQIPLEDAAVAVVPYEETVPS